MSAIPDWIYDELKGYESGCSQVRRSEVEGLSDLLDGKTGEHACQRFLETHPAILATYGRSGHGEWVIPKPRFGERYVPDFLLVHGHSGGLSWTFVEIESPRHRPFNRDGTFSCPLRKAIDQIQSWRAWIEPNLDYVHRPRSLGGLGLFGLRPRAAAKIIIGRREIYPSHYNDLRRQAQEDSGIYIMSYDRFLDWPTQQAAQWDRPAQERIADFFAEFGLTLPRPIVDPQ